MSVERPEQIVINFQGPESMTTGWAPIWAATGASRATFWPLVLYYGRTATCAPPQGLNS
jgi:hypothetical protein